MADTALYRRVWRWHFYAGLFVLPFILVLSVTGAIYLFKPQLDRWEERAWLHLPQAGAVSADQQVEAALAALKARGVSKSEAGLYKCMYVTRADQTVLMTESRDTALATEVRSRGGWTEPGDQPLRT